VRGEEEEREGDRERRQMEEWERRGSGRVGDSKGRKMQLILFPSCCVQREDKLLVLIPSRPFGTETGQLPIYEVFLSQGKNRLISI